MDAVGAFVSPSLLLALFCPELEASCCCLMPWVTLSLVKVITASFAFTTPLPHSLFHSFSEFPLVFLYTSIKRKKKQKPFQMPDFLGRPAAIWLHLEQR